MLELDELRDLVEGRRGNPPVEKADIETAIQALLAHQIVYPDTSLLRRDIYDLIRRHSTFFERYFSAMGVGLVIEPPTGMIALVRGQNRYGWQFSRLNGNQGCAPHPESFCDVGAADASGANGRIYRERGGTHAAGI